MKLPNLLGLARSVERLHDECRRVAANWAEETWLGRRTYPAAARKLSDLFRCEGSLAEDLDVGARRFHRPELERI